MTPQQRGAETMKDRRQLAAVVREITELRSDVTCLRAGYLRAMTELAGIMDAAGPPRTPDLTVITNESPRPSRRPAAQLRLVGSDR